MLMGPNGANFWSNLPTLIQIQANYNTQLIKHIKKKTGAGAYAMYVDEKVQTDYNKFIRDKKTMGHIAVLAPGCRNFYTVSVDKSDQDVMSADSCDRTQKARQLSGIHFMDMYTDGECENQTTSTMLLAAGHLPNSQPPDFLQLK